MAIKFFYETKNWSTNWMCKQLEVSRAAYYKWLHREIPEQETENMKLSELIKEYDERFNHILGYTYRADGSKAAYRHIPSGKLRSRKSHR